MGIAVSSKQKRSPYVKGGWRIRLATEDQAEMPVLRQGSMLLNHVFNLIYSYIKCVCSGTPNLKISKIKIINCVLFVIRSLWIEHL